MKANFAYLALVFPVANVLVWGFFTYTDWPLIAALRERIGREPSFETYFYYVGIPALLAFIALAHGAYCMVRRKPAQLVWQAVLLLLLLPYLVFYIGAV